MRRWIKKHPNYLCCSGIIIGLALLQAVDCKIVKTGALQILPQLSNWVQQHDGLVVIWHALLFFGIYFGWALIVRRAVLSGKLNPAMEKSVLAKRWWLLGAMGFIDALFFLRHIG